MVNVAFSITERFIINPVMYMRAPLRQEADSSLGLGEKIWHFVEAELIARVAAIFISFLAAADAFIHLSVGIYKRACLDLQKFSKIQTTSWNDSEVNDHFKAVGFYAFVALIGSIAGVIWPGVCKSFRRTPSCPPEIVVKEQLPRDIYNLYDAVINNRIESPYEELKQLWAKGELSSRHWFVQAFNFTDKQVRETLANTIYRPISHSSKGSNQVKWLNEFEVADHFSYCLGQASQISKGFFFHATSEKAIESILKTRKIEVRHEKTYRGAFVSTTPELAFGNCILVFRRNIERLSKLQHGFTIDNETYWAGFSQDIPVAESTLAYIILNSNKSAEVESLGIKCEQWAGRKIEVVSYDNAVRKLNRIDELHMGIPSEWPEDGDQVAMLILNSMKLAMANPQKVAIQQNRQKVLLAY